MEYIKFLLQKDSYSRY